MRKHDTTSLEGLRRSCVVDIETGCWLWRGALARGYGKVWDPRTHKKALVHRLAFVLAGGVIPGGYQLDHLCRVRRCFCPAHLRPVTQQENLLAPGSLALVAREAALTHCPQGHPYSGDNLYTDPRGWRGCRECKRARDRAWKATHRDERNAYKRERRAAHRTAAA